MPQDYIFGWVVNEMKVAVTGYSGGGGGIRTLDTPGMSRML